MSFALCWLHPRIITIPTITTTTTTNTTAVSGVTDMRFMFYEASAFNQPLSTWDGKCRCCFFIAHDESKLFHCRLTYVCRLLCAGCIIESSPLLRSRRRTTTTTAVSSVTNMGDMFHSATSFNQDLSSWDGKCWCCFFIAHAIRTSYFINICVSFAF